MKFKLNQKVRIVNNDTLSAYLPENVGKIGYISSEDGGMFLVYSKPNGKGEFLGRWFPSELEPVRGRPRKTMDDFMSKGLLERPLPVESHTFLLNGKKAEVTMDSERVEVTIYEANS